ncbi:hypothetical protein SLE2022_265940 [Rubroshorea leprosula]
MIPALITQVWQALASWVRDSRGAWLHGLAANIGSASSFMAKLWGLREGLRLRRTLAIERLVAELDSFVVVQFTTEIRELDGIVAALVMDTRALMSYWAYS